MTKRENTLCFTGPRSYTGQDYDQTRLWEVLNAAYRDGYRIFISGMAEGFDLAAAEAVLSLKLEHPDTRLIAAVPYRGQASGFSGDNKTRHAEILGCADEVAFLQDSYSHGCYLRRNDWMIDRSSRLICRYDGSDGGTRYTVRRALRQGLYIVNIYRAPGTLFPL